MPAKKPAGTVSLQAFASLIGMSQPWVSAKIKAGMPCEGGGRQKHIVAIETAKAIRWLFAQEREAGKRERKGNPKDNPADRLRMEQADAAAMKNARERGELCVREDVLFTVRESVTALRNELDGLPGRLAAEVSGLPPAAARERIRNEILVIEANYARRLRSLELPADLARGNGRGDGPAASSDAGPVGGR